MPPRASSLMIIVRTVGGNGSTGGGDGALANASAAALSARPTTPSPRYPGIPVSLNTEGVEEAELG